MELHWEIPEGGYKKINVHCVILDAPLPNGNQVSIASLIRDSTGAKLWGALGPLPLQSEEQAIMTGIQAALIHAQEKGWELTHIETTSMQVYDTVTHQEHFFLDDVQLEAYGAFNTIYANHYEKDRTKRVIACIPARMNGSAAYMANYGLNHASEFGEISGLVGELEYYLARDMGMTLPRPTLEVALNIGDGEVIDGPPPSKKRKCTQQDAMQKRVFKDKGKDKVYEHFSFNDNGLISSRALHALESNHLSDHSPEFSKDVINLDAPVGTGIYARDVLHHAVTGSLQSIIPKLYVSNPFSRDFDLKKLMSVDKVLALMGFTKGKASSSAGPV